MKLINAIVLLGALAVSQAVCPNGCSGHGTCNSNDICTCYTEGKKSYFGAANDPLAGASYLAQTVDGVQMNDAYTGADCSLRTCPKGMSFTKLVDDETDPDYNNAHKDNVECSDRGSCNRDTGVCECVPGWEGSACHKSSCPNECSGHGVCQSNLAFAKDAGARFVGGWDSGLQLGCKCDSGYRGLDCSKKECPSKADPLGFEGANEGRDCSGRGLCDYATGKCQCFSGYNGVSCNQVEALI